ncbi:MAG: ABC transporter permease, partial [Deltaproteobacteria bacterium]|nr:ABC transporter permease [Deltaproteobacteria bacterium]
MLRLFRKISVPQLTQSWGRTLLVMCGTATGVTLIVAINIINTTVVENFRRTINLLAGPAALEITLGVGEIGFSESALATAAADPDVEAAIPLVRATISRADAPAETLQLFGVDLVQEEKLARYAVHAASREDRAAILRGLEDPHSVLLTTELATRLGLSRGSELALATPSGVASYKVSGLLEAGGVAAALGGAIVVMDLPAAQFATGKEGRLDQIDLMLREGSSVVAVRDRLRAALAPQLTVERPERRGAQYDRIFASFQAMLTGISTLCLIAGVFIVYNTTSTGALRRVLALATLRHIGAD